MNTMTPPVLTYAPETRTMSGQCGQVALPPGPGMLVERLLAAPGKLVPRADLLAVLALPETVGAESDAVLRSHLKTVRVLAAALSGGAMSLLMRGQDAAGLMPTKAKRELSFAPMSLIPGNQPLKTTSVNDAQV